MADWYNSSVAYAAIAAWQATHTYAVGNIVRQLATPTVGNERCFRVSAITTGISGAVEPTWVLTKAGTTSETTVTWIECTGNSAQQQNGGVTNTWTAPHARLENMLAWMAAGDRGFLSSDHTQTKAATINYSSPGINCQFFSVNRTTGNIPPIASDITAGAAITNTGAGVNLNLIGGGRWEGLTITAGTSTDAGAVLQISTGATKAYLKNCALVLGSSAATGTMFIAGTQAAWTTLENCTYQFGNAGHVFQSAGGLTIIGGSIAGATIPTVLFGLSGGNTVSADIRGFDASALTSGTSLISGGQTALPSNYNFSNCKLAAAASVVSSASRSAPDGLRVDLVNCDSGATTYRNERHRYQGDMTTETTITRTGGATNGTQKVSHKVITTANASINNPFELPPIAKFNKLTGSSRTATIEFISSASLNNNDIWVELEYLGSSSTPISSVVNNTIATQLTSSAAQTSSAAAWGSSPATPVTQKLVVTFTPQMAGLVIARVKIAKSSTTLYVDPKITIS